MLDTEVLINTIVAYRVYSKASVYGKFKSPKAKNRSFALKNYDDVLQMMLCHGRNNYRKFYV